MSKGIRGTRALALATAVSVVALGASTTAVEATPGNGKSQGHSTSQGQSKSQGHSKSQGQSKSHENTKSQGKSKPPHQPGSPGKSGSTSTGAGASPSGSSGQSNGHGQPKGQQAPQGKGGQDEGGQEKGGPGGDPAGNNGTVKITPHGEADGIPQNTPHVGCDFDVEWYGFDEGADIISTVTFQAWSPTRGQLQVVDGDLTVFVGGDPASGAGTDSGFDGEEHYTLSFPGIAPHPQQGYHVKLTIHTPGSRGADTKHKVFWVEDCERPATPEAPEGETPEGETPEVETPEVAGEQDHDNDHESGNEIEVLGQQATAPEVAGQQATSAPPTAVDAGLADNSATPVSSVPLLLTLYGAMLAGLAMLIRRRRA